jgi:predicted ATPase/DNA-binding SARP family transcriptional activator
LSASAAGSHATRLEFRILGPLEVLKDGTPLPLGPRKQRALLALLLLNANRVVSTDRLIDELWTGRPPPGAAKTLRSYVSRLRALVGASRVLSRPPGYMLTLEPGQLDAQEFERRLGQGRDALAGGDASGAAERLSEGLTLWRGAVLADVADEPFVEVEAGRLEELRLEALEERIEADLECGRHAEVVAELEALLGKQQLRERLWGQLMTALYRSGRQADALAAYRRARRLLADRLGLEPGEELRALEQRILRHDLEVETAVAPRHNLPIQLTSFIGREEERRELSRLVPDAPLVTLTGVGGCGKTRLALEVAHTALPRFPDGVFLVELAGLTNPDLVPYAVGAPLGIRERAERPVVEALMEHLRGRALLLVLDNCEHLLDACAELVGRLLGACPELRVLATSRGPLALAGEHVYRVPPLAVGPNGNGASRLDGSDAVKLFVERAAAASGLPEWGPAELETVASICRELDGLPLALELAAARTPVLTVQEIAARLDDRFRFLRYWRRSTQPRHQTLGATMAWSYGLLSAADQVLLRRLSVFASGFTLEGAAAVCLSGDTEAALGLLTRLVDGSLVIAEPIRGKTRYRMLETVRRYAADRLEEAGEADVTRTRHAAYFLELAEEQWEGIDAPTGGSWWTELQEVDNLRAAVGWYISHGRTEDALRLVCALTWFWERTDRIGEGRMWCDRALALPGEPDGRSRAQALYAAGCLGWLANDFARAAESFEQSLELFGQLRDELWLARVLDRQADLHFSAGELEAARAAFEASRRHFENLSRPGGVAAATHGLGQVARDFGDIKASRSLLSSAADMYRGLNDRTALAATLHSIGDLELDDRHPEAAARRYEESLSLARETGMGQRTITYCLAGLAAVAAAREEVERAGRLWGAVEQREDEMGVRLHDVERRRYERLIAAVGEDGEFARGASTGRELTLDQAVVYAQASDG